MDRAEHQRRARHQGCHSPAHPRHYRFPNHAFDQRRHVRTHRPAHRRIRLKDSRRQVRGRGSSTVRGQGGSHQAAGNRDAPTSQPVPEFLQGPGHPLLGGLLADAQGRADVAKAAPLEVAEHHRLAVGVTKVVERLVHLGFQGRPGFVGRIMMSHRRGFLFSKVSARFVPLNSAGDQTGRPVEPGREDDPRAESGSFAGQQDEHGLGDILGQVRIPDLPDGGGMHQIHMSSHQGGKGGFRPVFHVFLQQIPIVHDGSSFPFIPAAEEKGQESEPQTSLVCCSAGLLACPWPPGGQVENLRHSRLRSLRYKVPQTSLVCCSAGLLACPWPPPGRAG